MRGGYRGKIVLRISKSLKSESLGLFIVKSSGSLTSFSKVGLITGLSLISFGAQLLNNDVLITVMVYKLVDINRSFGFWLMLLTNSDRHMHSRKKQKKRLRSLRHCFVVATDGTQSVVSLPAAAATVITLLESDVCCQRVWPTDKWLGRQTVALLSPAGTDCYMNHSSTLFCRLFKITTYHFQLSICIVMISWSWTYRRFMQQEILCAISNKRHY